MSSFNIVELTVFGSFQLPILAADLIASMLADGDSTQ
jgi:hypothetical protein